MFRCLDCGSVFDECDVAISEECVGEYQGAPAYEHWQVCPFCESSELELFDPDLEFEDEILTEEDIDYVEG